LEDGVVAGRPDQHTHQAGVAEVLLEDLGDGDEAVHVGLHLLRLVADLDRQLPPAVEVLADQVAVPATQRVERPPAAACREQLVAQRVGRGRRLRGAEQAGEPAH
jgi:hypothetical protein